MWTKKANDVNGYIKIEVSTNCGSSWTAFWTLNSGIPDNTLNAVEIESGNVKWIGTTDSGLVKFDGINWQQYKTSNSGLPKNKVTTIAVDTYNNKWVGTFGGGLAVFNENGIVGIKDEEITKPKSFYLNQNYPNPFNPTTIIQYSIPNASNVEVKVYDVLGNEVATLVDEHIQAGSYEIKFDANRLSSGVYFYKIQAGRFVDVKKMILTK